MDNTSDSCLEKIKYNSIVSNLISKSNARPSRCYNQVRGKREADMKKILISAILCVTLILSMTACRTDQPGETSTAPTSAEATSVAEATEPLTYKVQYFRTGGYVPETEYPYVVIVQSAKELADYISENRDEFDFESWEATGTEDAHGMLTAIDAYDDAFFSKNALLIVVVQEPSGSNRHEFLGFGEKNEIRIRRIVPEVGTTDMADWHILIELPSPSPILLSAYYPTVEWVVGDAK